MNALTYQTLRRNQEMGVGAIALRSAPPAPTSAGWSSIPNGPAWMTLSMADPAFKAAYQASREMRVQGAGGMVLWKTWTYKGIWYASSRPNRMFPPTYLQYKSVGSSSNRHGTAGVPEGLGDSRLARLAPYMDSDGFLDVDSYGYDPGLAAALTNENALFSPDLSRWGALPVKPSAGDKRWVAIGSADLARLQGMAGWLASVQTAQASGTPVFKFQGHWYKYDGSTYASLAKGSSPVNALAGPPRYPGMGATNPNFAVPSGMSPTAASSALQNAVNTLLTTYAAQGVPSEHVASAEASAVQSAWDADPIVVAAGSTATLDVDSSYGPNTFAAVAAVNGGSAPPVNTGSAPAPYSTSTTTTTTTTTGGDWTTPLLIGAGVLAAGGIVTAGVLHWQKRRVIYRTRHAATHRAHA